MLGIHFSRETREQEHPAKQVEEESQQKSKKHSKTVKAGKAKIKTTARRRKIIKKVGDMPARNTR